MGGFLLACGLRFGACDAGVLDFRLRFGWFGCQLLVFGDMLFEVGFGWLLLWVCVLRFAVSDVLFVLVVLRGFYVVGG